MIFIYEMCPHCMERLIERIQPMEDGNSVNLCPKCRGKMVMACYGEQRIDNTIYKFVLNNASVSDHMDKKNRFISTLMKMGDIDFDEALKRYQTKDCVIFEGNASNTYVNMGLLDNFTPSIQYSVVPAFQFERLLNLFISICPICGSDTIHKTEDVDVPSNYIKDGFFCEKCNKWIMSTTMPKSENEMLIL